MLMAGACIPGSLHAAETHSWETLNTAGMLAYKEKDLTMAKELFERALTKLDQEEQPDPRSATTLNNLAAVHEALGEFEQAELRYRNSLTIIEAIQGPEHPDIVLGLNNLASLYFSQEKYAQAEPLWRRGLIILENFLGLEHPHLVQPLHTLGLVTHAQQNFDDAEAFYTRAIHIAKSSLGPRHPQLVPLLQSYASLLRRTHRLDEANMIDVQVQDIRAIHAPPALEK